MRLTCCERSIMRNLCVLTLMVVFLSSCGRGSERAVLRVRVNSEAWSEHVKGPPGSYGTGWPPVFNEFTGSRAYSNAFRLSLERVGMDPHLHVRFRWEDAVGTNAVMFLSTSHPDPDRVAQVASNAFFLWLNESQLSDTMRVSAP
jgi:hypothetical protein